MPPLVSSGKNFDAFEYTGVMSRFAGKKGSDERIEVRVRVSRRPTLGDGPSVAGGVGRRVHRTWNAEHNQTLDPGTADGPR
jgi:hypothetical protein